MEQDERNTSAPSAGATRSQHTVYTLPHDWALLRRVLSPVLERAQRAAEKQAGDVETSGPAVLVLTPDADGALAAADIARRLLGDAAATFIPVTAAGRATRVLRADTPLGISGTPTALLELVRASTLKLGGVRTVVIAWGEDLLAAGGGADLEVIFGELPKGERVLVTGAMTEELESLVERYMRRPRRAAESVDDAAPERLATPVHYLTVAATSRPAALRRLLDELDPSSAAIVASSEDALADARLALATLGYAADDADVRVTSGEIAEGTELVVLYELPHDAALLRRAATERQVVALVQPRQLAALRRLSGDNVAAFTLSDPRRHAQSHEEAMRDELRRLLGTGAFTRELMTLEPLLAEYDGVEVAAALLRLLDEGRRRRPAEARRAATYLAPEPEPQAAVAPAQQVAPAAPAARSGPPPPWTRVYVNVGSRDGAGAGDILGALAGEAQVERTKIGRIELRDSHSLVEVATDVVERVVEAASTAMMRGRQLIVRVDQDRGDRPERPIGRHDRGDRGPRAGGDRFERGPRREGGARFERSDRPERGNRFERSARDDRGPRSGGAGRERFDRGDRPTRDDRGGPPPRREGGFRPREGGFKPREGGFKPREGGFKPREGGFKPREGGFKPREGGFKPREGGVKPRGEGGGFREPREGGRDAGSRGGGRGGGFRNPRDEHRASFGRTLNDEQREWADRADRVRNARRTPRDET